MISIEAKGPAVWLNCEGPLHQQTVEILTAVHAWTCKCAELTGAPKLKEVLRQILAEKLADEAAWAMTPEKSINLVEVDDPRELFEEGEP